VEEVLPDLEFEEAVQKWREHYGQIPTKPTFFDATLVSNVKANDTTIDLSYFNGLPSPPFTIKVGPEEMQVTRLSGHVADVSRGASGTIAAHHYVGDWVSVI
jgi:hypothetical protein